MALVTILSMIVLTQVMTLGIVSVFLLWIAMMQSLI
jgi:hypothetical protein